MQNTANSFIICAVAFGNGMEINMKLLILNGPNLNFLGIREPEIYGKGTYAELCEMIKEYAGKLSVDVELYQSNHEGDLVDAIQKAYFEKVDGIVFNPAAYTHTSVAIADAVKAVGIPTVEIHISDVSKREDFRQISYVRPACIATVCGEGFNGYLHAMDILKERLSKKKG